MATKWKSFSRSGAFKAVLAAAYIACTAAAGVVTGYGGAYCYDKLTDDGIALIFDARERYEKIYCRDRLVTAMADCGQAYEDAKEYTIDYAKIVEQIPFGVKITDDSGNVYSNTDSTEDIIYSVSCDDSAGGGIRTIALCGIDSGDEPYDDDYGRIYFMYYTDGEKQIDYGSAADNLPFAANISSDTASYENMDEDSYYAGAVNLTLKPVKSADGLLAENVYLTVWKDEMSSAFMTAAEPDFSVYRAALDKLDFYCRIKLADGTVYENSVPHGITAGYNYSEDGLPSGGYYGNTRYVTDVEIGVSDSESSAMLLKYNNGVHDMRVMIITDICLAVLSTAILIYLCHVIGETPDGERKLSPVLSVFYEVTLTALTAAAASGAVNFLAGYYGTFSQMDKFTGGVFESALTGIIFAGISLLWLYLWLCLSARSKSGTLKQGSLIYRLIKFLRKIICGACAFLKDLFLGRMISGGAVKRLLWTDAAFIAVTIINALLFLWSAFSNIPLLAMLFIALEVIFAGLFFYARFMLIRDVSKLQRQIEDVYLGKEVYSAEFAEKSPFRQSGERLEKLGEQYRRGMEERVKAERMKIALVTNVSHDLKTPLTSIISYIDLLSREELPQTAADYVAILQSKSERLKNIVADVFELAKATSGEITAESSEIDLAKLSYQALADMEDKIAASGFEVRRSICEPPVTVMSDGRRIYRIIQNLLDNALKYSMEGTRIYYTLEKRGGAAVISIKNISAVPIELTAEELTERFVRGDKSRSTEGSGLGLSIAQGFALACGGELKIDIDGDMFRAEASFPLYDAKN